MSSQAANPPLIPATTTPTTSGHSLIETAARAAAYLEKSAAKRYARLIEHPTSLTQKAVGKQRVFTGIGVHFYAKDGALQTSRTTYRTVAAMLEQFGDAKSITVSGTERFRRLAWIQGTARGLTVNGYEPEPRDHRLKNAMVEQLERNRMAPTVTKQANPDPTQSQQAAGAGMSNAGTSQATGKGGSATPGNKPHTQTPGFDPAALQSPQPAAGAAPAATPGKMVGHPNGLPQIKPGRGM